ncbi:motility associated factor glycosyltransferase family protein [Shewanella sp. 4_MG-2023]|uniref:motility associated factor glycosyltransferase family protein n=1 Tax=Shewanella sp. 4_MG-2023 TaxID=3062652 RepID=UPI0026E2884D|nr:6-hydroxymethylpterin diphosphokinase MptE-like protein [Shewanella sp. 4_MG-2023]MDO6679638.1 DUF115 domain-containing protein [Shewanella sp. 4_MG-2023]
MSELFAKNMQVINKRWPAIAAVISKQSFAHLETNLVSATEQTIRVNGIQLSSCYDRVGEAKLLIEHYQLSSQKKVAVYGLGMGDVPTVLLLTDVEQIDVHPLNYALFAMLITYTDQSQWLMDKRVSLIFADNSIGLKRPRIAITPDLELVDDAHAAIRDVLVSDNVRAYNNQYHDKKLPETLQRFNDNATFIEQMDDAALLLKTHKAKKVFVIGAGPTLEDSYDFLKKQQALKHNKPLLIAVDTAYMALAHNGVIPDIVVSMDALISMGHFPEHIDKKTILVSLPTVTTDLLANWPGPQYMAYSQLPLFDDLCQQHNKMRLYTNGSVIHPAVDLAVKLGAKKITLFGADFCYPDNKTHAHWEDGALGPSAKTEKKHWVINGFGERVGTDLNFRGYLRSLEYYIHQTPNVRYFQASLKGAKISGSQFKECI